MKDTKAVGLLVEPLGRLHAPFPLASAMIWDSLPARTASLHNASTHSLRSRRLFEDNARVMIAGAAPCSNMHGRRFLSVAKELNA